MPGKTRHIDERRLTVQGQGRFESLSSEHHSDKVAETISSLLPSKSSSIVP